jgi:DNA-binding NarL/FixJ family response regulator
MRVALIDNEVVFRQALAALLREMGVEVMCETSDERDLLRALKDDAPDAVIVDIRLTDSPIGEGLYTADRLRATHPDIGILMFSAYAEPAYAERLLKISDRGVGYLLKQRVSNADELLDALQRVAAGGTAVDHGIVQPLIDRPGSSSLDQLTEQEHKVLYQMALGRSNAGIEKSLFLGRAVVERHIKAIFTKLGLDQHGDDNRRVLAVLQWLRERPKLL